MPLKAIRRSHVESVGEADDCEPAPRRRSIPGSRSSAGCSAPRSPIASSPSDPTVGVVLPRKRKAEAAMRSRPTRDVAKLLNAAEPANRPDSRPGFTAYVALCAFAGLRRGEALGVQVGDIDFLARTLRVTRQLQRRRLPMSRPARSRRSRRRDHGRHPAAEVRVRADDLPARRARRDPLRARPPAHAGRRPGPWLFDEGGKPWHDNLVDYRWRSTRTDAGVDTSSTTCGTTSPADSSPPGATSSPSSGPWVTRLPLRR